MPKTIIEVDIHGKEIRAGDVLFNPYDQDKYHTVIEDVDGSLFLDDFTSPLERYSPHRWWEIVVDKKEVTDAKDSNNRQMRKAPRQ